MSDPCIPDGADPLFTLHEREGLTVVLEKAEAQRLRFHYTFEARLVTLNVHSSLQAVGFIAVVAAELANAGIPCNVLAGFYHDHLLLPVDRVDDAMQVLRSTREAARTRLKTGQAPRS